MRWRTSLEEYHLQGHVTFPDRVPGFLIGSSRPIFCQSAARPHCGDFVAALQGGDIAAAGLHLRDIIAIAEQFQGRYFARGYHHVAVFKAMAGLLGMRTGPVRPGIAPCDPGELEDCIAVMVAVGLISPAAG